MPVCSAVQQSDEMFCAKCGLRWDVNDPEPPACRKSFPETQSNLGTMTDREATVAVAADYREMMMLIGNQKALMAKMIRLCVKQMQSSDNRKRKQAIDGLNSLASMLEGGNKS